MSGSTNIISHPADQQSAQPSAQQPGAQQSMQFVSGPRGPKFRYCYSVVVRCVSKQQPDTMPPATTGQGETTTTTQVSQGENPKFELTLQTRTCFGNRSYGAFPLEHVGRCIAPEEEGEEVVVAHIQLVFYMVVDSSPHKFTGVWDHALSIKTNDIRNQEYNRLPTLPEAEDRENAADMMQWGRDFPRTKEEGGIVPYVKGMLKRMVRNTYAYHESERTADGKPSWSEVKDSFDESIRPLDEDLVIGALVGALAQVRQDCEMYDMVRGGITIG